MYYAEPNMKWAEKIDKAVDFLFPMNTYCILCGKYVDKSVKYVMCDSCMEKVGFGFVEIDLETEEREEGRTRVLDSALSCMSYGLYEKNIGLSLKNRKATYIARIIAEIMYDRIMNDPVRSTDFLSADMIIPVPLSKERFIERGFNQAEKIAVHLGHRLHIPVDVRTVARQKETQYQKKLSREERFVNLYDAFSLKGDVKGKSIILLDDFYTTGATSYTIARLLKENGAGEVHLITLATRNRYAYGFFKE